MFGWFKNIIARLDALEYDVKGTTNSYENTKTGLKGTVFDLRVAISNLNQNKVNKVEFEKLKAIVAELCDHVYKDQK